MVPTIVPVSGPLVWAPKWGSPGRCLLRYMATSQPQEAAWLSECRKELWTLVLSPWVMNMRIMEGSVGIVSYPELSRNQIVLFPANRCFINCDDCVNSVGTAAGDPTHPALLTSSVGETF